MGVPTAAELPDEDVPLLHPMTPMLLVCPIPPPIGMGATRGVGCTMVCVDPRPNIALLNTVVPGAEPNSPVEELLPLVPANMGAPLEFVTVAFTEATAVPEAAA